MSSLPLFLSLSFTIASADMGYAFLLDDKVEAICGVGQRNDPWLVATDELEKHPVMFYRASKPVITEMKERYDWLENWIDEDNKLTIRWLEWAGFSIDAPGIVHGFRRLFWKKEGTRSCVRQ